MTPRPLSPRMEEVVRLVMSRGLTYSEVATELGISERTVRNYAHEIGVRCGRRPRAAITWYYSNVLVRTSGATL